MAARTRRSLPILQCRLEPADGSFHVEGWPIVVAAGLKERAVRPLLADGLLTPIAHIAPRTPVFETGLVSLAGRRVVLCVGFRGSVIERVWIGLEKAEYWRYEVHKANVSLLQDLFSTLRRLSKNRAVATFRGGSVEACFTANGSPFTDDGAHLWLTYDRPAPRPRKSACAES